MSNDKETPSPSAGGDSRPATLIEELEAMGRWHNQPFSPAEERVRAQVIERLSRPAAEGAGDGLATPRTTERYNELVALHDQKLISTEQFVLDMRTVADRMERDLAHEKQLHEWSVRTLSEKLAALSRAPVARDGVIVSLETLRRWYDDVRKYSPRSPWGDKLTNEMFAVLKSHSDAGGR